MASRVLLEPPPEQENRMSVMSDEQSQPAALWAMAEHLSSPADADTFFRNLFRVVAKKDIAEAHARAVLNIGLQTLKAATQNDPATAADIIITHILPICLERESPIDSRFFGPDHLR